MKCDQLVYNTPRSIYVVLASDSFPSDNDIENSEMDISHLFGTFTGVTLKYLVKDCDPNTSQVLDDEGYVFIDLKLNIYYLFFFLNFQLSR